MNDALHWFQVVILAIVQGLTEFLPVSSSGHLVLTNALLKVKEPGIALELILHLGTLLAVVIFYRRDLRKLVEGLMRWLRGGRSRDDREAAGMVGLLILATIPAVVGALLLGDFFKKTFENPLEASIELMITGVILLLTLLARRGKRLVDRVDAVLIGLAQFVAILPGISRSGTTIATGLFRGVRPEEAARFSFLLSIPAILGGAVFDAKEIGSSLHGHDAGLYLLGFLVAFALGYVSIAWLLKIVKRGRFFWFGIYCLGIGALGVWLLR